MTLTYIDILTETTENQYLEDGISFWGKRPILRGELLDSGKGQISFKISCHLKMSTVTPRTRLFWLTKMIAKKRWSYKMAPD